MVHIRRYYLFSSLLLADSLLNSDLLELRSCVMFTWLYLHLSLFLTHNKIESFWRTSLCNGCWWLFFVFYQKLFYLNFSCQYYTSHYPAWCSTQPDNACEHSCFGIYHFFFWTSLKIINYISLLENNYPILWYFPFYKFVFLVDYGFFTPPHPPPPKKDIIFQYSQNLAWCLINSCCSGFLFLFFLDRGWSPRGLFMPFSSSF